MNVSRQTPAFHVGLLAVNLKQLHLMNYIRHLTGFFEKVAGDQTLNPTHISLYIALFQFWNFNRFRNPISISRDEVMAISKISSKATYHKCLKNLHALGYIDYQPSFNPFRGSHVVMFDFAQVQKPLTGKAGTKNERPFESAGRQVTDSDWSGTLPAGDRAVVPSVNNTNNTNISDSTNGNKHANKNTEGHKAFTEPLLAEVQAFFNSQEYAAVEAEKFYNYFSSNGWLVGGRSKMKNWHAAARNWIINSKSFTASARVQGPAPATSLKNLNVSGNKSYNEKL